MIREPWADINAAADHLSKSVFTVRRWAQTGTIPGRKVRGRWMFQLSAIDDFLTAAPDPWAKSPRSKRR